MPSPYPHIGSLNQPITIEVNNPAPSAGSGQLVDNWTAYKKTLAAIGDNSGTEKEKSESEISTLMTVFTIRYFPGITAKMRINYDGDYYNIKYIARIGRNRYLKIKGERVI
jgi:SPP1 family predicted phage head-tail adaptor